MSRPNDELRARLAVVQHERREALYEAREAHGESPSIPPPPRVPSELVPRDKLPTLDDLTGPDAPKARWKLAVAAVTSLVGLSELARQIVALVKH